MARAQLERFTVIKFVGAGIIFISSLFWGFKSSLTPYKRYKNLIKINSCLNTMKNEIRFSSDYIDDVLIRVAKISEFDYLFKTATALYKSIPISERWKKAVTCDAPLLHLSKEDTETLKMFGLELGMTDREGQLKNIENTMSMLETLQSEAKEDYDKTSRLRKGLGVSVGLFTIILLYWKNYGGKLWMSI